MQNPQERPQANLSVVGSCSVTDCRFNEDHECHAGQIEVRVGPDGAHCGTYQPEASLRPRPYADPAATVDQGPPRGAPFRC